MLCVDTSLWHDRNGFAEPDRSDPRQVPLADGFVVGCVRVTPAANGLQTDYRYEPAVGGAPDRRSFAPAGHRESTARSLGVREGGWVRVCYNGRFSGMDAASWWYEQVTVNVAWFAGEPDGRVFIDREPAQEVRSLAELW